MPAPLNADVLAVSAYDCCINDWETHVLALKTNGCIYQWRPGGSPALVGCGFDLPLPPLGPFSKSAPANGASNLPSTVTLSWSAPVTGTVHSYRYCYATTTGCTPSTQVPSTTTSVTVSGLTPGATYHWQVRACAIDGCGSFTDANGSGGHWSFTVASAPGAFGKSAPANRASGQPTNPTLSWGAASGTVNHYRYCIATTPGCVPGTSAGTATSVGLSGLAAGTTYYWQVRACADSDCTVFTDANGSSGHWSFTVASAPGAFGKSAPANGASGQPTNPTLSWSTASGTVNHYRYCVATTTGCTPGTSAGTATSVGLSGLTAGTTHYWQVRACADAGCTVFTDANGSNGHWSFTVAAAPGAFGKSAPTNGATGQPTNPTLSWGTASGTVKDRKSVV